MCKCFTRLNVRSLIASPEFSHLELDENSIRATLDISLGLAKLVEQMRQLAEEEMYASAEWIKWLKFGEWTAYR